MFRKGQRAVLASALLVVAAFGLAPGGATSRAAAATVQQAAEQHCVGRAIPANSPAAIAPAAACFSTFAEAISFATGGAVSLPADSKSRALSQSELAPAGIQSTVISIDFLDASYQGSTFTWYTDQPGSGCAETDFYADSYPGGWDNVVSSSKAYQFCAYNYHYEVPGFLGTRLDCGWECAGMGIMNDNSSSRRWANHPLP